MITATGDEIKLSKNNETNVVYFDCKLANSSIWNSYPYENIPVGLSNILTRCTLAEKSGVFTNTSQVENMGTDASVSLTFGAVDVQTTCTIFAISATAPRTQREAELAIARIGANINHVLENNHSIVPSDASVEDTGWVSVG